MAEQQDGEREPQPIDEEAAWAAIVAGYGEEPADPPGARPFRRVEDLALPDLPGDEGTAGGKGASGSKGNKGSTGTPGDRATPGTASGTTSGTASGAASGADRAASDGREDDGRSSGDGKGEGAEGRPEGRADSSSEAAEKPDKFRRPAAPDEPGKPALGSSIVFAPGVGPGGPRDYSPAEPDEGHFVPPEPPPLPEADTTTKFAWLAAAGGPVLMLLAVLLQWDMTWWLTTLCVGGFLGGFVTLVARMKSDDEDEDGFDDPGRGAVV
ncbi:hypothetical protein ACGFRB_07455 [Streptomyces sp. NPDC048718]|uniref:hypothetical protein n=1 Tax=Streptomyces sp. NPDC048718 TaxID=3365587 RepID=UPI0037149D81